MAYIRPVSSDLDTFRDSKGFAYVSPDRSLSLPDHQGGCTNGRTLRQKARAYGLTLPMYRVLAALWHQDGQRLGDLSEMTSVEISTLSRLIGAMRRNGLLSRMRPGANGRTVEISLTRTGRVLVERLIPLAQRHEKIGLSGLDADDVKALKKHLVTIYRNLDVLDREISEREAATRSLS
jgi:MarR family transcriptional regulator, organic hydroperoxide resistance regulator